MKRRLNKKVSDRLEEAGLDFVGVESLDYYDTTHREWQEVETEEI